MPHCAAPSRHPCAIALLRDRDSDNVFKPFSRHEKSAIVSSVSWYCGSVSQSAADHRPVSEGSDRVNSFCLWGLIGPNKDMTHSGRIVTTETLAHRVHMA